MTAKVTEKKKRAQSEEVGRRGRMYYVPWSNIVMDPKENPRSDYGDLEKLYRMVRPDPKNGKEGGIIQPLWVKPNGDGKLRVIDGFRRYYVGQMVYERDGIDLEIPVRLAPKGYKPVDQLFDQVKFNETKRFAMLENARIIKRAMEEFSCSQSFCAREMGLTEAQVSKINKLNSAPAEMIKLIESGDLAGTEAVKILVKGPARVEEFLKDVKAGVYGKLIKDVGLDLGEENKQGDDVGGVGEEFDKVMEAVGNGLSELMQPDGTNSKANEEEQPRKRQRGSSRAITASAIEKTTEKKEESGWVIVKKTLTGYQGKPANPEAAKVLVFLLKVLNNEITPEYLTKFFKPKAAAAKKAPVKKKK